MGVRARGGGFQADVSYQGGERHRAQFLSRQEAEQWEADTRAALIAGRPLPATASVARSTMTVGGLQVAAFREHWKGTKNERMAEMNSRAAVDHFGALTPVSAVTVLQINGWKAALKAKGNSPSTINRKLATLSMMLGHAVQLGEIPVAPPCKREKGDGQTRDRYLREAEAEAFEALLRHWALPLDADFFAVLIDTGARLGEAFRIRGKDVGHNTGLLAVGALGSKNGEVREIAMTKRVRDIFQERRKGLAPEAEVFGSLLNEHTFRSHFIKARNHLSLGDDVVIHTLRHTTASWMVQRGVDLGKVKNWMGHKSYKVTLGYAKYSPKNMFQALELFERPAGDPSTAPTARH